MDTSTSRRSDRFPRALPPAAARAALLAVATCCAGTALVAQGDSSAEGDAGSVAAARAFRSDLRAIATHAADGTAADSWASAKQQLEALLEKHEDADHVRYARDEIVDLHRRLSFEAFYVAPKPKDLISGKLVSYNPKNGKIKLVYTRDTMADFADPNKPRPPVKREPKTRPGGFPTLPTIEMPEVRLGPVYRPRIHPAQFRSCKIEVRGARYSSTELLSGIHGDTVFRTMAGEPLQSMGFAGSSYLPTVVIRQDGKQQTELFKKSWLPKKSKKKAKSLWPMERGGKYTIVLDVTPKSLSLRINRKSVVKKTWREPIVGSVGITDATFDQLTLTGQVEPAWIDGLKDQHRQKAREKFAADYEPTRNLPSWVFTQPKVAVDTSASKDRRYYPGKVEPEDLEAVQRALTDLGKGRSTRVLFRMALWKKGAVPPLVKQYLQSYAYLVDRSYRKAIELGEQVVAADPDFGYGRVVLGQSYLAMRRNADAERQFREVLRLEPTSPNAYGDLAMSLVRQQRAVEARKLLGDATSRGLGNERLRSMRRVIDRIVDGPRFGKSFTVETEHYRITSDIDEKVCKDAGKVLENALTFYRRMLGNVTFEDGQRFQVYLFSGEQGYKRYLDGLELRIPIHTAGVYSPKLQQLLIWNLSVREDMLRTIRHEGFHQYFDMLAADAPVWLNEGLAEYFEVSRFKVGKPSAGVVRPRHVRTLALVRSRGSIEDFFKITPRNFYGPKASLNYSKSWALVRYLRGGTPKVRAVFDRLVDALSQGKSREEALELALEGVDMERLSKGFWASVDKLVARK